MSSSVSYITAFLGGFVSFLSPCVLPLVPGYLSTITGLTPQELAARDRPFSKAAAQSLLFIAGFALVFVAFGATASVLGSLLVRYRTALSVVGGIIIMLFGIFMLDVVKIPGLYREVRADMRKALRFGYVSSFVLGVAFGAGWTPCVGPILASILALAASSAQIAAGTSLLFVYSLGLGIPFFLLAILFRQLRPLVDLLGRHVETVRKISGILLIVTGFLIAMGWLGAFVGFLTKYVPLLG